jgi:DNA-binding response OmpR family regulator
MPAMTRTILLVKDSEDDVLFIRRALKLTGANLSHQIAPDGQVAIDYMSGAGEYADRKKFPLPVMVLLDLKLPRVLGLDVLKWIRARREFGNIPVIIMTASGERADWERGYRLGANSYMIKPSSIDELMGLAKCLTDYWFKYSTLPRVN